MKVIPASVKTLLKGRSMLGNLGSPRCSVTFTNAGLSVGVSNMRISRDAAATAQQCSFEWPNVSPSDHKDIGYYSPDRAAPEFPETPWKGVVMPGAEFIVEMGYGVNTTRVFTGTVDDVTLHGDYEGYMIAVETRDYGWRLVDKVVDDGTGVYFLKYESMTVEQVVIDLLLKAGWVPGDVTVETTGITVSIIFRECSYADAIEKLSEVSGFELSIDEFGKASWYYPTDRQPAAVNEPVTLTSSIVSTLDNVPVASGSEVVTDASGSITYVNGVDYNINYKLGRMFRYPGSSIPSGATVLVDYVYAAWVFKQGEDIFTLDYTISRRNVYGKIRVRGAEKPNTNPAQYYTGVFDYGGKAIYGIPDEKVLFSTVSELAGDADCLAAATQMGNDMVHKVRQAQYVAVGVPWIQLGDSVQVIESSSTISEIYRLTSLEFDYSPDGFIMTGTAYHYGQ